MKKSILISCAAVAAFVGDFSTRPAYAAPTYTFESLTAGTLAGQDNWQVFPGSVSPLVGVGSGVDSTNIAQGAPHGGAAQIVTRNNDANFSLPAFSGTETAAIEQFDSLIGVRNGGSPDSVFALGHSATPGPFFGFSETSSGDFFYIREAAFGAEHLVPIPSTVLAGDWLRFQLTMNFVANGGDGSGDLFYQDLTNGTAITPVPGLQNINLKLTSSSPSTWDTLFLRLDNETSGVTGADNLTVVVPEPSAVALLALTGPSLLARRRSRQP